jgi:hypothetical protein
VDCKQHCSSRYGTEGATLEAGKRKEEQQDSRELFDAVASTFAAQKVRARLELHGQIV